MGLSISVSKSSVRKEIDCWLLAPMLVIYDNCELAP